eukprot:TRINITY_DN4795_c0_g1_i1.p1 TRINITY_DN4795_c0_g1~~TRINITY_DN4795_c0_g1_i1.p1  ORF type:complete len:347 (+),score=91.57 TRINITY_DN4795_c0_g1_i1:45-1043(+)
MGYLQNWCQRVKKAVLPASVCAPAVQDDIAEYNVDVSPCSRFDVDDPAALEHLSEHGYVVFRSVADAGELQEAESLLWQFLEARGMQRSRPATWTHSRFPGNPANGVIVRDGFGQSQFLWYLRSLPKVAAAFARVWGTDDLITSMDGGCVYRPWAADPTCRTIGGWYHVDQGADRAGMQGVQGVLTLLDADATTGGLVVVPGSHRQFDEIRAHQTDPDILDAAEFGARAGGRLVTMKAGDIALFDSRCVHCNFPGSGPPRSARELVRAAGFVAMLPRHRASDQVKEARREAFRNQQTLSCWADEVKPQSGAHASVGVRSLDELTAVQRALLG